MKVDKDMTFMKWSNLKMAHKIMFSKNNKDTIKSVIFLSLTYGAILVLLAVISVIVGTSLSMC